jgi:hypothetical protein
MSEQPKAYSSSTPKARKEHRCCECRGMISTGERYHFFSGVWDTCHTYKTCTECEQLRSDVSTTIRDLEDYPAFGQLYECVFEGRENLDWVKRYMDTRRKRNAPESPRGWMEKREVEMNEVVNP